MKNRFSGSSLLKLEVPFRPWVYFGIFLVSNTILSYAPLPLQAKLWVGLIGIALPLTLGFQSAWKSGPRRPSFLGDHFPSVPAWLWVSFFLLLFLTRFYRLTTLPFWPLSDEGISGFLGMEQARHWQWRLLWAHDRVEPLFIWSLGVYFKWIEPSLFSLRLLPALVSLATVLAAYGAARQYFSKSLSFIIAWLFAFSFWELSLSRISMNIIPVPLFQCLCFWCLGIFLKSKGSIIGRKSLWTLSLLAGVGFYTWTNWAAVWLCLVVILAGRAFLKERGGKGALVFFLLTSFLCVIPLALARMAPGELDHIQGLFVFSFWEQAASYATGLFWDGSISFPFGSNWGGFLNPLLTSFAFLGVLSVLRTRNWFFCLSLGTCLCCSLLPGLFTGNVELYRVLPLFPFLMVLAAFGLSTLSFAAGGLRFPFLLSCLAATFTLDVYNYVFHYSDISKTPALHQWRNVQYHNAFEIARKWSRDTGPLYLFSEFNTDYDNKTLNIACYPFDSLQNPSLAGSRPRWAVLILNSHFAPYFIKRFPGLKFKVLKTDKKGPDDPPPFGIFLIPTEQIAPNILSDWIEADHFYRQANIEVKNRNSTETWGTSAESLVPMKGRFSEDPLLTSVFWEKFAFFKYLSGDFKAAADGFRNSIEKGVPVAHLYYDLGISLKAMGKIREGDHALKKAEELSQRPIF